MNTWCVAAAALSACLVIAAPAAAQAQPQRGTVEALPGGPVLVLAVAREDVDGALAAGRDAPGGPARPRLLRFFFSPAADEARCAIPRRYAMPKPDVLDARTGLCTPGGDFAPTPPRDGVCYGVAAYRVIGKDGRYRNAPRGELAVARARDREKSAETAPPFGPRFIVDPAQQPRSDAPARYLFAVSRLHAATPPVSYLSTLDVFGAGALPALTSAESRAGALATSGGLSIRTGGARVQVVGPLRLVQDGGAQRVVVAEAERPALVAELARVYGVATQDIAFVQTAAEARPLCAPLTQIGEAAARILEGRR